MFKKAPYCLRFLTRLPAGFAGVLLLTACAQNEVSLPEQASLTQTLSEQKGKMIQASFNNGKTLFFQLLNDSSKLAFRGAPDHAKAYSGDILIPDSIRCNGRSYSVEEIQDSAFLDNANLTSVQLPAGLKRIGKHAFKNASLSQITIPEQVEWIGESAFMQISKRSLRAVHFLPRIPPKQISGKALLIFSSHTWVYVPKESFSAYLTMPYISLRSTTNLFPE